MWRESASDCVIGIEEGGEGRGEEEEEDVELDGMGVSSMERESV